jgi:hypothetical protein
MEAVKHLFGFCGDTWHPSLLMIGMFSSLIYYFKNSIKHIYYKIRK